MRRLTAGLVALLAGFAFVVANAGGAGASPNLVVTAANFTEIASAGGCCGGPTQYLFSYSGSATVVGTLNAGGHAFIGTATLNLDFGGHETCTGNITLLQTCSADLFDGSGTIAGSGVGSIAGTCASTGGSYKDEAVLALVTLPLNCSVSFSGSAPQPVSFTLALLVGPVVTTSSPSVGVGVG